MEHHLDLVGGMAGDMFIAALLDAFPHFEHRVVQAIDSVNPGHGAACASVAFKDHVLCGRRFDVQRPASHHHHVTWTSIRERLTKSALPPSTRAHAIGIFKLLADAEAAVHGVDPESVEFHEVGSWDSIADIVGAAALIDAVGGTRWTASAAPLGSGRIRTDHGLLPVPAPATTQLMMGMQTIDDGIGGERVTPTGAAILRYLCPPGDRPRKGGPRPQPAERRLVATGTGFGTRTLPGLSNHLRVMCFEVRDASNGNHRHIDVLEFEVDDQSGEDLATGLDRLRMHDGVLDVTQTPAFGKKGRMMAHVRVLAGSGRVDEVIDLCFRETTTIGLRRHTVQGIGLARRSKEASVEGHRMRVKVVDRPGGRTAKAESDDVSTHQDHARRSSLRSRAAQAILASESNLSDQQADIDA